MIFPMMLYPKESNSSCESTYNNVLEEDNRSTVSKQDRMMERSETNKECTTYTSITTTPQPRRRRPSPRPSTTRKQQQQHVTFSSISIRWYEVVIGNHPSCHSGCPMSLGWNYHQEQFFPSVEDYEASRVDSDNGSSSNSRKKRNEKRNLRSTSCERYLRLLENPNCSKSEIRRASRLQQRSRDRRIQRDEYNRFFHQARADV